MLYSGGGTGASTTSRTTFDDGTDGVYYEYDAREGVRPSRGPSSGPPYALSYTSYPLSYPYAPAYRDAPVSPDTRRQVTSKLYDENLAELDNENLAKGLSMSLIEADAQNFVLPNLEQENALLAQMSFDEANARAIPYSSLRDSKYEEDEEFQKNLAIAQVASLQDSRPTTYAVAQLRYIAPGFRKKSSERPGPSSLLPAETAPSEAALTPDDINHVIMSDPMLNFEPATDRSRRNKGKNPLFRKTAGIRRSRKMRKSKRRRKRITKRRRKTRRRH